jgi:hypothetical protein
MTTKNSHTVNLKGDRDAVQETHHGRPPEGSARIHVNKKNAVIVAALVFAMALGWIIYSRTGIFGDTRDTGETDALVAEVRSHIMLPYDETPKIATVVDPTQYANDPLLSQSKVGDKVLVYPGAKKAILYRPSEGLVVDIMGFELPDAGDVN